MGISPIPSDATQTRSDGRCAAHVPGGSASARLDSVAATQAVAREGGMTGELQVIVIMGIPMVSGTAQSNQTSKQGSADWV